MRNPCLRCLTSAAEHESPRRDYSLWPVCKPRSASSLVNGDQCRGGRGLKFIVAVFQFDDLQLQLSGHGKIQVFAQCNRQKNMRTVTCNFGDHIPEVVATSTWTCRCKTTCMRICKSERSLANNLNQNTNPATKFFREKRRNGDARRPKFRRRSLFALPVRRAFVEKSVH